MVRRFALVVLAAVLVSVGAFSGIAMGTGTAPSFPSFTPDSMWAGVTNSVFITISSYSPPPGGAIASGSVAVFVDNVAVLQQGLSASGSADVPLPPLQAGTHSLRVDYSGDSAYAASSTTKSFDVTAWPLAGSIQSSTGTTPFSCSPGPQAPPCDLPALPTGSAVTITVTTQAGNWAATPPASLQPSGPVTFSDGYGTLGTANMENGVASWTTTTLAPGNHGISASYPGNAYFAAFVTGSVPVSIQLVSPFAPPPPPGGGNGASPQAPAGSASPATPTPTAVDSGSSDAMAVAPEPTTAGAASAAGQRSGVAHQAVSTARNMADAGSSPMPAYAIVLIITVALLASGGLITLRRRSRVHIGQ